MLLHNPYTSRDQFEPSSWSQLTEDLKLIRQQITKRYRPPAVIYDSWFTAGVCTAYLGKVLYLIANRYKMNMLEYNPAPIYMMLHSPRFRIRYGFRILDALLAVGPRSTGFTTNISERVGDYRKLKETVTA